LRIPSVKRHRSPFGNPLHRLGCAVGGKPLETQRGGPARMAGTDLPYHGAAWRSPGSYSDKTGRAAASATRSEPAYFRPAYALRPRRPPRRTVDGFWPLRAGFPWQLGVEVSDADAPPAHRGLLDMRLVGCGARALATAALRLLPAGAALTLEVLACGGRSRWHRGRLTGAMMTALDPFYLEHHRCDLKSEPKTIASG